MAAISFSYGYEIGPFVPDHCLALNGFGYQDFTDACQWGRTPFQPFVPLPDRYPAIYFGFNQPLPVGLVSLYIDIPGLGNPQPGAPSYVWEYQAPDGFAELPALDETAGFTRSGMVQVIGPTDLTASPGPDGPTYWIRARTQEAQDPSPSDVNAVYLNATWATQRTSAIGELLGRSDGTPRQAMQTQHAPVLENEVLEVQEWSGTGRAWESLFGDVPADRLRFDTDPRGNVTGVWVRWEPVPYLYGRGAQDRVYTIERTTGLVRFGELGIPPPGAPVSLSYDYGGGTGGNLAPGTITQLYSAVPNLQQVSNPVVAAGGAAGETIAEVRRRGPERLKNAGRAVAAVDYEWLAREASPEVAVARCLSTTGPDGYATPGWVTIVIAPQSAVAQPEPSQELIGTLRAHLTAQAPAAIAGQIRIAGPRYLAVSVVAEVIPRDPSHAAQVEDSLTDALDAFLHPVTGGPEGTGWEFGASVHLSQIVEVILGTAGVAAAPQVALVADTDAYGDAVPIPADCLPCSGNHLLKLTIGTA